MLRTLLGPLVVSLQLLGLYVLFHGHYSPGGGFQAGILISASLILPLLAGGRNSGHRVPSLRAAVAMTLMGVSLFTAVGILSLGLGASFLDYGALAWVREIAARRYLSILIVEVGVALAVTGAMLCIFYALMGPIGQESGS